MSEQKPPGSESFVPRTGAEILDAAAAVADGGRTFGAALLALFAAAEVAKDAAEIPTPAVGCISRCAVCGKAIQVRMVQSGWLNGQMVPAWMHFVPADHYVQTGSGVADV